MTELVIYLTKQRQSNLTPENNDKDKQKPKEVSPVWLSLKEFLIEFFVELNS